MPALVSLRDQIRGAWKLTPGKPALTMGLRAALTATAPVILGIALNKPAAVWAVAAGFTATTVDKGGAYRTRALALGSLFVLATIAVFLGALVASNWIEAAFAMLAWAALLGFAPAYGDAATSVATASTVLFAVSLGVPPNGLSDVWTRVAWMCAGMAWACLLTLGLWPVRVYRPGRIAVSDVFSRLADHVRLQAAGLTRIREAAEASAASDTEAARDSTWGDPVRGDHRNLRESIETARRVLAATRRGRRTEAGRGERLLVLLEIAEQIFGELVAITARVDTTPAEETESAEKTLGQLAEALAAVARDTRTEGRTEPPRTPTNPTPRASAQPPGSLEALLGRAVVEADLAMAVVGTLYGDEPLPDMARIDREVADAEVQRAPLLEPLRQNLTLDSDVLRHALRLGVTAAIAILIVHFAHLVRGSWVTLTVVLLLQPHAPATRKKIVQRVGGTMLGGLLAALIVATVHGMAPRLAIVALFAATSTAVLQINYGVFSIFLTPTFVLLGELSAPNATLAYVRMENTLIGGALALVSATLLWPHGERDRLSARVADVFAAVGAYAATLAAGGSAPPPSTTPWDAAAERLTAVTEARRKTGLAINNAEASFERLLAELRTDPETLAPWMTMLTYSRRMVGALGARASGVPLVLVAIFGELEAAVRARRPVTPSEKDESGELGNDDTRLLQLAHVLTTAVDRAADPHSSGQEQKAK